MNIGDGIHVNEIATPDGVRFLDDPDQMVVSVAAPISDAKLEALLTSTAGPATEPEVLARGRETAAVAEGALGAEQAGEAKAGEKKETGKEAAAAKAEK